MALQALKKIKYRSDIDLAMSEIQLNLQRCLPSQSRWIELPRLKNLATANDRATDVKCTPSRRFGFAIIHRPSSCCRRCASASSLSRRFQMKYAVTGLKLKARSPLQPLMNIELANGAEGYIPPPEQYYLGGYTT